MWSQVIIDGNEVKAEYVDPEDIAETPKPVSPEWYDSHVQESQDSLHV